MARQVYQAQTTQRIKLPIAAIRIDGATQPRAQLDSETIEDYAAAMRAGVEFPPVTVFYDGAEYWLADGFHRVNAAGAAAGKKRIAAEVHQGTREDAQWFSYAANQSHGLRRSNADKQRAIRAAIEHAKSKDLSDRQIAEHVGVDHKTVAAIRRPKDQSGEIPHSFDGGETPGPEERSGEIPHSGLGEESTGFARPVENVSNASNASRSKQKDQPPPPRRYVPVSDQVPPEEPAIEVAEEQGAGRILNEIINAREHVRFAATITEEERRHLAWDRGAAKIFREGAAALIKLADQIDAMSSYATEDIPA